MKTKVKLRVSVTDLRYGKVYASPEPLGIGNPQVLIGAVPFDINLDRWNKAIEELRAR